MGKVPSKPDKGKMHLPNADETRNAAKYSLTRPDRPATWAPTTEVLLEHIDTHLTDYRRSIKTLKGNKSPETEQQLLQMMSETESDLHKLNQQLQPKQQEEGNTKSYCPSEEKKKEDTLQTVLLAKSALNKENENLKRELREERIRTEELNAQNKELLLRLSKAAGDRLVENNPAITDLSDKNRPTKLGEIHSELYDNEWTDAFEALRAQTYDEDFIICTLYLTLVNVFDFCKKKSESLLMKTEDAVNFLFEEYDLLQKKKIKPRFMSMTGGRVSSIKLPSRLQTDIMLQHRWKLKLEAEVLQRRNTTQVAKSDLVASNVKKLQKEVAESMTPVVQKAYMKACWIDGEFVPELKPFIKKCIFLCWMMVVQSPPMSFHMVDVNNSKFDTNLYKAYTAKGPLINFDVWPALLLHEDGPVVGKGVAQGCDCP